MGGGAYPVRPDGIGEPNWSAAGAGTARPQDGQGDPTDTPVPQFGQTIKAPGVAGMRT
ncbi:hypothetical protein Acsp02_43730 [Actinoplanes sp. NBRC 103695]|nr:hypothetical protein Acsp02_43730 [Actinoplanes sp. NBRC 103695]